MNICPMPGCQTTAGCICDRVIAVRHDADQQELMRINNALRQALLDIKGLCAGDKVPRWKDDWATTHTRGQIMDIVDGVVRL